MRQFWPMRVVSMMGLVSAFPAQSIDTNSTGTGTVRALAQVPAPAALWFKPASASSGLVINVVYDASVNNAPVGFTTAVGQVVNFYESHFSDPVTVTIDVGYGEIAGQALSAGALGETETYLTSVSYSQLQGALVNNANAIGDTAAAASLPSTSPVSGGNYYIATAEAAALGISGASTSLNAYCGFSSAANFCYNDANGVASNQYDFFGVVAHEFSEAMGRQTMDGSFSGYEPLDLFHYSAPGVRDFSGTTAGYASANGGNTKLNSFNTNSNGDYGDWASSAGHDAFLAFTGTGVVLPVTANDLTEMNVLGWDPTTSTSSPAVISSIVESPSSGDFAAGKTVTLTLDMNEAVTVNTTAGTPTLTLNDGATATYTGGSGSNALTFSYTVGAGQNTAALAATAVNLNGATVQDGAGNAANFSLSGLTQTGPQIDTTTPVLSSIVESPASADLAAGKTVTLTLDMNEAVTVNTTAGTPTLTLNDGATATYTGGSGSKALTFSYTVGAGQNTAALAATAVNLNGATVHDGAGNAANFSLSGLTQTGPQIDTTAPTINAIAETPSSGDLNAGKVVTYTLTMSEVVTFNTTSGTPTLSLNDFGTGTYVSGSGSNTLTFSYTVLAGQNTPDLMVSAVSLNGATITDGAGNAANLSLTGLTQGSPQIDTTTPVISAVVELPSSGDLNAGKTVTFTLDTSEVVTINTTVGTPTLTLNDGSTATYVSGSGTSALTFSYTVGAGQNISSLAATTVNLNGATITDGAGNSANVSLNGLTQTGPQIDTTAPAVTVHLAQDTSGGHNITANDALAGTGDANAVVTLSEGATVLGTATANASGAWSFTPTGLAQGAQTITASETDVAGNTGSASLSFTLNSVAPTVTVGLTQDTGSSSTDHITSNPALSGTAQANSVVTLTEGCHGARHRDRRCQRRLVVHADRSGPGRPHHHCQRNRRRRQYRHRLVELHAQFGGADRDGWAYPGHRLVVDRPHHLEPGAQRHRPGQLGGDADRRFHGARHRDRRCQRRLVVHADRSGAGRTHHHRQRNRRRRQYRHRLVELHARFGGADRDGGAYPGHRLVFDRPHHLEPGAERHRPGQLGGDADRRYHGARHRDRRCQRRLVINAQRSGAGRPHHHRQRNRRRRQYRLGLVELHARFGGADRDGGAYPGHRLVVDRPHHLEPERSAALREANSVVTLTEGSHGARHRDRRCQRSLVVHADRSRAGRPYHHRQRDRRRRQYRLGLAELYARFSGADRDDGAEPVTPARRRPTTSPRTRR